MTNSRNDGAKSDATDGEGSRTSLRLEALREAVLYFLELVAGFEQRHATPGFREYGFSKSDEHAKTIELLDEITERLKAHHERRRREQLLVRLTPEIEALAVWIAGGGAESDLDSKIAPRLAFVGAGSTAVFDELRRARRGDDEAFAPELPKGPTNQAKEAIARLAGVGISKVSSIRSLQKTGQSADHRAAIRKPEVVAELEAGEVVPTVELLLAVLVALRAESKEAALPERWVDELQKRYAELG